MAIDDDAAAPESAQKHFSVSDIGVAKSAPRQCAETRSTSATKSLSALIGRGRARDDFFDAISW
jgi:hypothetical protein